jgi:hypothetical protein
MPAVLITDLYFPDCMTDLLAPTTFSPPRVRLPSTRHKQHLELIKANLHDQGFIPMPRLELQPLATTPAFVRTRLNKHGGPLSPHVLPHLGSLLHIIQHQRLSRSRTKVNESRKSATIMLELPRL